MTGPFELMARIDISHEKVDEMKFEKHIVGRGTRATAAALLAVLLSASGAADDLFEPRVSTLKLRPAARVTGNIITAADVVVFKDADPRLFSTLAERPIRSGLTVPGETTVTLGQLRKWLKEQGVNMARVLLCGATECRVRADAVAETTPTGPGESAPLNAPLFSDTAENASSLRAKLMALINREMAALGGRAQIELQRGGESFLSLTSPPWDFQVRSMSSAKLGAREFSVVVRRDGRVQRTAHLYARVRLIKRVVVADKPLNSGLSIGPDDVRLEERIFDSDRDLGVAAIGAMVGQQVKRFVAGGEMLRRADVKAVDLVKRSRPVSLIGASGNISMRLRGTALDSGGYGDTVRVRLGDRRSGRRVMRGVVTGLGTVRVSQGGK